MIVVSDTSALSSLIQVNQIGLLQRLYSKILIPAAVETELLAAHSSLPSFLEKATAANRADLNRLMQELDAGEAEAILLAKERAADLLLIDETIGRRVALRENLRIIGLLGVLVQAKHAHLISSVRQLTDELERVAGFRAAPAVKTIIFAQVNE